MSHKAILYDYCSFQISNQDAKPFSIKAKGRNRWALERLIDAGKNGCTPINNPAPRWSAYVFNLRRSGIQIETLNEQHSGYFSGNHARYVLRSVVEPFLSLPAKDCIVRQRNKRFLPAAFTVTNGDNAPFNIVVMGHDRWALELLINAGESGCKPIEHLLPRWSANICHLRIFGLYIMTLHGIYTCYVLRSVVEPIKTKDTSA